MVRSGFFIDDKSESVFSSSFSIHFFFGRSFFYSGIRLLGTQKRYNKLYIIIAVAMHFSFATVCAGVERLRSLLIAVSAVVVAAMYVLSTAMKYYRMFLMFPEGCRSHFSIRWMIHRNNNINYNTNNMVGKRNDKECDSLFYFCFWTWWWFY